MKTHFCCLLLLCLVALPGRGYAPRPSAPTTQRLATLGRVWGLLKYYHPGLASGQRNWDSVLVATLPPAQQARSRAQWKRVLTAMCDAAGPLPAGLAAAAPTGPAPAWLQQDKRVPPALRTRLTSLVQHYQPHDNVYVTKHYKGNVLSQPLFIGEKPYEQPASPAAEYRLLALFRFWNAIEYYYPFKAGMGTDWLRVLPRYLPDFAAETDTLRYHQLGQRLAAELRDSHANATSPVLDRQRATATVPFAAICLGEQLVVSRLLADSLAAAANLRAGDIITHLDGQPAAKARARLRPFVSGSTPGALERDLTQLLLNGPLGSRLRLTVRRGTETIQTSVGRYAYKDIQRGGRYGSKRPAKPAWEILPSGVGYVRAAAVKSAAADQLMAQLHAAPAIIFDMRGYPDYRLGAQLARHLYPAGVPSELSEEVDARQPSRTLVVPDTARRAPATFPLYTGQVLVLVNESTQSAAEGFVMTLQAYPRTRTVGSTTAGANGNQTFITLPGDLTISFSGVVIKYPDGTPTQRHGVRIDVPVRPTAAGLAAGRDEVLEKALRLVATAQ